MANKNKKYFISQVTRELKKLGFTKINVEYWGIGECQNDEGYLVPDPTVLVGYVHADKGDWNVEFDLMNFRNPIYHACCYSYMEDMCYGKVNWD